MVRTDIAAMASALRDALASAGSDVQERKTGTGRAYLVSGRALAQLDESATPLRVRLWLPQKERRSVEQRPTFDTVSGWLHVISDDDVAFLRGLLPIAYRAAATGEFGAAPTGRVEASAPPAPPKAVAPAKKEGGPGRPKTGAERRRPA